MRRLPTDAEAKLWSRLRAGRMNGWKFRRQVSIQRYIVDFVCPSARLVIEVDGSQHADNTQYDDTRTKFLQSEGYRVLRFWNNEVLMATDVVCEQILSALNAPLPGPSGLSLSPEGEG